MFFQKTGRTTTPLKAQAEFTRQRATPVIVSRCLLCSHAPIEAEIEGRFLTTSCPACRAVLSIEFDPPDQPELRARIERITDPD